MEKRTFEELLAAVYPTKKPQLNLMENINFYSSLSGDKRKCIDDTLLTMLKSNFRFVEFDNRKGCGGLLSGIYAYFCAYESTMRDIIETTSPIFSEIFSYFPDLAFGQANFDLNADPVLSEIASFDLERTSDLLTYSGVSLANTMLLTTNQTFESLIDQKGNDVYDTARLIALTSFSGTSHFFNLNKPLFPASLLDKDKKLMVTPSSFFPNRLYGTVGSVGNNLFAYTQQVVEMQLSLMNIFNTVGENWVEKIIK